MKIVRFITTKKFVVSAIVTVLVGAAAAGTILATKAGRLAIDDESNA